MKLLIIAQKIDKNDPVFSFFHGWVREFAKNFESITVICLEKGTYDLPENVRVLSLGKEEKVSKIQYLWRFYKYIWRENANYETVLVHMNREYLILGGWFWRLSGKKVTLWSNHPAGNFVTDIAVFFCHKVFCTSRFSYTAKYMKTEFMPVGVDLDNFKPLDGVHRVPQSILFLGRISPVKRPDIFIEALLTLRSNFPNLTGSIYGDPLPKDEKYYQELKEKVKKSGAENYLKFYKGIPNSETPAVYSAHEIFVNLSPDGMYDKTIFEAMACGCLIAASNDNLRGAIDVDFIFGQGNIKELAAKLEKMLGYTSDKKNEAVKELQNFALKHSLKELGIKLLESLK